MNAATKTKTIRQQEHDAAVLRGGTFDTHKKRKPARRRTDRRAAAQALRTGRDA